MNRNANPASSRDVDATAARWVARRDAGLSPAEEAELQQWIDADPSHRFALAFYGATWSTLAQPAQNGAAASLEQHLATLSLRRRQRRIVFSASLALVLLTGGIVRWNYSDRAAPLASPSAQVLVPSRQSLPDGSIVELKQNSKIDVLYGAGARRVALLEGEAHFAVEKDPTRPFVVSVSGVDVRAVGTAFSVQKGTSAVEVLVTHGKVAVERPSPAATGPSLTPEPLAAVEAGNLVVVEIARTTTAPASRPVPPAELDQRLAWRSPRLEFTRTPLAEAIALINRHTIADAPQLAVSDPAIASLRISGVFRADNIDAFVLLLEGVFDVKAERTGSTIFLRQKR
jgi:transmembrane sensor